MSGPSIRSDQMAQNIACQVLKSSKGNLLQCLFSLFHIFVLNLSLSYTHGLILLSSHHTPLLTFWLCLLNKLLVLMCRMLLCPPEAASSPGQTSPGSPSHEGQLLQFLLSLTLHLLVAHHWIHAKLPKSLFFRCPKTGCNTVDVG